MLQEVYKKEILRQINNLENEIRTLQGDYLSVQDEICKSQIKTFLERKENALLKLYKEALDGNIE